MSEPGEYPIDRGRLVSNRGLDIAPVEFEHHVVEEHVEHSNALYSRLRERGAYLAGPMARYGAELRRAFPARTASRPRRRVSGRCPPEPLSQHRRARG